MGIALICQPLVTALARSRVHESKPCFPNSPNRRENGSTAALFHETGLSVTVGVDFWIESLHERWLPASLSAGAFLCRVLLLIFGRATGAGVGTGAPGTMGPASGSHASTKSGAGAKTSARSLSSTEGTTNAARLALEPIKALLTAGQDATLFLEVGHADGWKGSGGVVLRSIVVDLMDGDGGVDNRGLDGFWTKVRTRTSRLTTSTGLDPDVPLLTTGWMVSWTW